MSQAAKKSTVQKLHDALAAHLLSVLTDPNAVCEACNRSKVDPRILATAAKFVRENDVQAEDDTQIDAVGFQYRLPEEEQLPDPEEE